MRSLATMLVSAALLPLAAQEPAPLDVARYRDLIVPKASEQRWLDIPWHATFWGAVQEARTRDRPVLLWAMNGHPLGCT